MTCNHRRDDSRWPPAGAAATPIQPDNPPGNPSLQRRVGTSGAFATAMAAGLTREPKLARLTTRATDDPSLALLDAWSAVLDVLAFYNERITNEGYLRTAVDPRSLVELAQSVGYQPGRGRASATLLAFTLEDAVGAPALVPVPAGTRVNSLPGPGEVPQTYETTAGLVARPTWNAMAARARMPQQIAVGTTSVWLEGTRTDLAAGDVVLVVGSERDAPDGDASASWAVRHLASVELRPEADATRIGWVDGLGSPAASSGRQNTEQVPDGRDLRVYVLRKRAAIFGAAAPDWRLISESVGGGRRDSDTVSLRAAVQKGPTRRDRFRLTGVDNGDDTDWHFSVVPPSQKDNTVDLDTTYPAVSVGSWGVLTIYGVTALYRVTATTEASRTDFTLNAKVTRLSLSGPSVSQFFGTSVRETTAWVGSELLPLATAPDPLPVHGLEVELAGPVPSLDAARNLIIRGPRPRLRVAEGVRGLDLKTAGGGLVRLHPGDLLEIVGPVVDNDDGTLTWTTTKGRVTAAPGALQRVTPPRDAEVQSEVAVVAGSPQSDSEVHTIRFIAPLTGCYDRETVRILGNVAPATHGETKTQMLGSGNAAQTYQAFTLNQTALTYVPTRSGDGVLSSLEVRVAGRLWREVRQLFGAGPDDEVYSTRMDDEGTITVCFGDGRTGSRLPTGPNNVTARFRIGTGLAGRVGADVLTLPMSRPLGLRSVTNPLPTGLAADIESSIDVRANAPLNALTLGRVVSLRDVEDFARSVPGIAQAQATWLWDGQHRFVHVTVVSSGGQALNEQARKDLRSVLLDAGDARLPLRVDAAELVSVHVSVSVVVDHVFETKTVLDGVSASVTAALSVESRTLSQPLTNGDVILAAHAVPGVVAVNVTAPQTDVPSPAARMAGTVIHPAHLVILASGGLTVTEAHS